MNSPTTSQEMRKIFLVKSALLCEGIYISPSLFEKLSLIDRKQYQGRKGGAGPAGGRYFQFSNGTIVNTPIWLQSKPNSSLQILNIQDGNIFQVKYQILGESGEITLELLPIPEFYKNTTESGILYKQIALLHGNQTLATTINQRCQHWRNGERCKFCGIELSLKYENTVEKKTGAQIVEVIRAARHENPMYATHLTLTIGTQATPGKGMEEYLNVVSVIHDHFPEIPIHIQIEPVDSFEWYQKAHDAGVSSIGIHLEILNDALREKICPGKKHISKAEYFTHWKAAVNIFGRGQVSTFIITGFDHNIDEMKHDIRQMIELGVLPLITPVRYVPKLFTTPPTTTLEEFIQINDYAAKMCQNFNLDPSKNSAGCIRCGGCSPMIEGFQARQP